MSTNTPIRTGADQQPSANWHQPGLPARPDPGLWERPDIRAAFAVRDITTLFRLLGRQGITQRRLAALVGMSQSEISEIVKGRQVRFYDVLARVADGLGIPRGYLGLADPPPQPSAATRPPPAQDRNTRTTDDRRRTRPKRARRAHRRRHVS